MHPVPRHPTATIALHWLSVFLLLATAATALSREWVEASQWRTLLIDGHRQVGLLVLLGLGLRLAARLRQAMAPTMAGMGRLARWAAHGAHLALYSLLLTLPVLGWAISNAHGLSLRLLGVLPLPTLVAADSDLADTLTDLHVQASWVLLGMVVLHVAAALHHHVVRRDDVLRAMLPQRTGGVRSAPAVSAGSVAGAQGRAEGRADGRDGAPDTGSLPRLA